MYIIKDLNYNLKMKNNLRMNQLNSEQSKVHLYLAENNAFIFSIFILILNNLYKITHFKFYIYIEGKVN
jgi:hypothetical protein